MHDQQKQVSLMMFITKYAVESILLTLNTDNIQLSDKIFKAIDSCSLFICDITPDKEGLINECVMLELGYAMHKLDFNNIILILNKEIQNEPTNNMIKGFVYEEYHNLDQLYIDTIIERIKNKIDKSISKSFEKVDYRLPVNVINALSNLMDVRYGGYYVFVDKNKKEIIIFMYCSGGEPRLVYVSTRNLMLRKSRLI